MTINESEPFKKDFKKLLKKYKTLEDDFKVLKKAISVEPKGDGSKHWKILKEKEDKYIVKTRMMCRAVKGSRFRVIYAFDGEQLEILLIEMYFKGNKETEDKKRIDDIFNEMTK